jgi:hypothetical protein
MATNDGKFFRGVIGKVVFRVVNGKQIAQQRVAAGTIKHSEDTKKSNQTFGMASTLGAQLRRTVSSRITQKVDTTIASRLSGQLFSILSARRDKTTMLYDWQPDSFEALEGFNFNPKQLINKRLDKLPAITLKDETLTVSFPQISMPGILKFPYSSFRCKLSVTVSLFRLADGKMVPRSASQEKMFEKAISSYPTFKLKYNVPNGCLYIVTLWLDYENMTPNGNKTFNEPRLHSAEVCEARISEGEYLGNDQFTWIDMPRF